MADRAAGWRRTGRLRLDRPAGFSPDLYSARDVAATLPVRDALDVVTDWLAAPSGTTVVPTARHPAILRGLLLEAGTAGNLTSDAHLAALAIEHGATICTYDRDFDRFPGVRWRMPKP